MAEVATGTSKRTGISGSVQTPGFDMRSWQGLTQLLGAARSAHMDTDAYAAFRDVVMEYAQGGGTDTALRQEIEAQISSLGLTKQASINTKSASTPAPKPKVEQKTEGVSAPAPTHGNTPFGSARRAPQFRSATAQKFSPAPENLPTSVTEKKEEPAPSTPTPESIQPATVEATPAPHTPAEKPKETAPTSAPAAAENFGSVEDAKRRVSEIKRTVLAEVGNPISMTDGGEAIGRDYMKALVNALKAVSGNAPGTLATSMQALETAATRVRKAAAQKGGDATPAPDAPATSAPEEKRAVAETKPEPTPEKEPIATPEEKIDVQDAPEEESAPTQVDAQEEMPETAPKPVEPQASVAEESHAAESDAAARWGATETEAPAEPAESAAPTREEPPTAVTPASAAPSSTAIPSLTDQSATPASSAPTPAPTAVETPEPAPAPEKVEAPAPQTSTVGQKHTKHTAKGLGQVKHDVTVDADGSRPVPPGVTAELQTPEITNGLNQLLQDWSLFRGSGFFGIGPGGTEHPLYEKLAQEKMSVVYGGHWEGAKREEILSIRDYINGWRHEQGVTYTDSETFEHYLRRVVSRILKRQQA